MGINKALGLSRMNLTLELGAKAAPAMGGEPVDIFFSTNKIGLQRAVLFAKSAKPVASVK
jgi:hypothetical protein